MYPSAICRGNVEAQCSRRPCVPPSRIPRLSAEVTLKMQELGDLDRVERGIPRRYAEVTLKRHRAEQREERVVESLGYVPR